MSDAFIEAALASFLTAILTVSAVVVYAAPDPVAKFVGGLSFGFWSYQAAHVVWLRVRVRRGEAEARRLEAVRDVMES